MVHSPILAGLGAWQIIIMLAYNATIFLIGYFVGVARGKRKERKKARMNHSDFGKS